MELTVLHEDDDALVIDKPSGWLVHNSEFTRTRERTVLTVVREARGAGFAPVHRLDRGTSGVLLLARGAAVLRAWQEALADAEKFYFALVRGVFREAVMVDHPIADEQGVRRDARSHFAPLWTNARRHCSAVRVQVFTGRTHQVRRHAHHLSHPVLGDANYGKGAINRAFRAEHGLARLALHAERLAIVHPVTHTRLELIAPLPDDLATPIASILAAG